ncbi:hypothetical protein [Actinopolymorpha pittospori]|uniref:Uncharacterized protein n=1 Tax=Actinopolymorpha pittospori TaxID=648752 RepID=A0A927N1J8_9ACTN|nr:hypothetical protein [Actinopolymorpha pittospori]MBE1610072.1 hypothetical protein [Actinopolymorpha pittospori]
MACTQGLAEVGLLELSGRFRAAGEDLGRGWIPREAAHDGHLQDLGDLARAAGHPLADEQVAEAGLGAGSGEGVAQGRRPRAGSHQSGQGGLGDQQGQVGCGGGLERGALQAESPGVDDDVLTVAFQALEYAC